ncbi:MAG: hypothetical protein PVG48_02095 [Candidatus Bathyarchaeota archaeon]
MEYKIKAYVLVDKPLLVSKCEKYGKAIIEPKGLIRIVKKNI